MFMASRTGAILDPFEHIRLRPDTAVGSIRTVFRESWVWRPSNPGVTFEMVADNPGLRKIFDEILSNAIDNKWRSESTDGKPMTRIVVVIDRTTGTISIENDGFPISAVPSSFTLTHPSTRKTETLTALPAAVFFGIFLSGTNYDDTEARKTSGRNGIGAKATNALSTFFGVEHLDPLSHRKVNLEFRDGASVRSEPIVVRSTAKKAYTRITFTPDYELFGVDGLTDDFLGLIRKSLLDAAMITGLPVTLTVRTEEGATVEKIVVPSLAKYTSFFFAKAKSLSLTGPDGGECVIVESEPIADTLLNPAFVAFVNGIATRDGGVHVDAWRDAFFASLVRAFNARKVKKGSLLEGEKVSARDLYPHFTLFLRSEVTNPSFDSQTKDRLNHPVPLVTKPTDEILAKVLKWNFVTRIEERMAMKVERAVARKEGTSSSGRLLLGKKARDANWAGSKNKGECILYIVEGDSARAFVEAGISAMKAHDRAGVLALRGKPLNASKATAAQLAANEELTLLKKILGLKTGVGFSESDLRYGSVCLMTDQDDDGFHIRALVLNFFFSLFPSLFAREGFLRSFSTPVLRVWTTPKKTIDFYSVAESRLALGKKKVHRKKYFKGLGAFSSADAREIFPTQKFQLYTPDESDASFMKLAFDPKSTDWRKDWILERMAERGTSDEESVAVPLPIEGDITLGSFIDSSLLLYFFLAVVRSIPSVADGFKTSQRKILEGLLRKNPSEPIKVSVLSGSVMEVTAYHHGETSLHDTMIRMAQRFVGSNNLPLLVADGQFGSRLMGGEDASAARYISTTLEQVTKALFPSVDLPLLGRMYDDGLEVEPTFFVPLLPTVLMNGACGISVGWSTLIPTYSPLTILEWIRARLRGEELPELVPFARGFTGEVEFVRDAAGTIVSMTTWGTLYSHPDGRYSIEELPIGVWTSDFKEDLEKAATGKDRMITGLTDHSGPNNVSFFFRPVGGYVPEMGCGPLSSMKKTISLRNMILLDSEGRPKKYASAEEIAEDFLEIRRSLTARRRVVQLEEMRKDLFVLNQKVLFLRAVLEHTLNLHQEDDMLFEAMKTAGLTPLEEKGTFSFDFLLRMPMRSMTAAKLRELEKEIESVTAKRARLEGQTPEDIWLEELDALEPVLLRAFEAPF